MSGRRWGSVGLAILALMLVVAIVGPGSVSGHRPYDPDSPEADGLLGLSRTMQALGADVAVDATPPLDTDTRIFASDALLSEDELTAWHSWVEEGGTLIVADTRSRLHDRDWTPPGMTEVFVPEGRDPACPHIDDAIREVVQTDWNGLELRPGDRDCFVVDADHSWMIIEQVGEGHRILLGSPQPFTNAWLNAGDNAALAAALLVGDSEPRVQFIPLDGTGRAEIGLIDLIPDDVIIALALLAGAVLIAVIAHGRRLGRPVADALPPVLPASSLATSLGGLSRRAKDREGAAAPLRAGARRRVARRTGLPADADPELLVERVVTSSHLDPDLVALALEPSAVEDDEQLLEISRAVAQVGSPPTPPHEGVE